MILVFRIVWNTC